MEEYRKFLPLSFLYLSLFLSGTVVARVAAVHPPGISLLYICQRSSEGRERPNRYGFVEGSSPFAGSIHSHRLNIR